MNENNLQTWICQEIQLIKLKVKKCDKMLSCNFKLLENVQSRNYISKKLHCPNELVSKHSSLHDIFYTE